jgi:hypothetical protein
MDKSELDLKIKLIVSQHSGLRNAIDRWDLVREIFGAGEDYPRTDANPCDRMVRRSIERLRHAGTLICNLGEGSGWFLASNEEEYQSFRAAYGSHAWPIVENIREMDRAAREIWPNALQPKLLNVDAKVRDF